MQNVICLNPTSLLNKRIICLSEMVNKIVRKFVEVPNTQGQLLKCIIDKGLGPQPKRGNNVLVHYVGTLALNGVKFDSSRDRQEPFRFKLGAGQVIKGWDVGVATMHFDETAILRCHPSYAYGAQGCPPVIQPNAVLDFEVQFISATSTSPIPAAAGVLIVVLVLYYMFF